MRTVLGWVVALLVVIGCGVAIESSVTTTATRTTSGSARAALQVSKLDDQLWAVSQLAAKSQGDPQAYDREAVGPLPLGQATVGTTGDGSLGNSEPVYVIELRGTFVCGGCSEPPGAKGPSGDVTLLFVDASTFERVGFALGNIWYDLDQIGKPFPLVAPPGGLTQVQANPDIAPFYGEWTNNGAVLRVAITNARITYSRAGCPVAGGREPTCELSFRLTGVTDASNPPGMSPPLPGPRNDDCANNGSCGSAIGGPVESDNVNLPVGTVINVWAEHNDEVEVIVAGHPSVPTPLRWCGPRAPKEAC